jgi:hypothetical protein
MHSREGNAYKVLVGSQEEENHSEDLDVGGMIILKWISDK